MSLLVSTKSTSLPLRAFFSRWVMIFSCMICCRIVMSGLVMSISTSGLLIWLAKPSPMTSGRYLTAHHKGTDTTCSRTHAKHTTHAHRPTHTHTHTHAQTHTHTDSNTFINFFIQITILLKDNFFLIKPRQYHTIVSNRINK